jgi:hypothetical protein
MGTPPVQSDLFPASVPANDVIDRVVAALPTLPPVIR